MQNLTTQLRAAEIVNDLLVVFGEIRNSASVVTIFDLEKGREKDSILCYAPKLSETKRYLVYRKFYPRFAEPPATSSLLLVYDLQAKPLSNRLTEKAEYVGRPIFPEENVHKQSTNVWIELPEQRHLVHPWAGYIWLDQDSKVVFVDKYAGENWLVLVDLSSGLDKVEIRRRKIDVAKILTLEPGTPDYERLLKEEKKRLAVTELKKGKDGKVIVSLRPDKRYKVTEIPMDLP